MLRLYWQLLLWLIRHRPGAARLRSCNFLATGLSLQVAGLRRQCRSNFRARKADSFCQRQCRSCAVLPISRVEGWCSRCRGSQAGQPAASKPYLHAGGTGRLLVRGLEAIGLCRRRLGAAGTTAARGADRRRPARRDQTLQPGGCRARSDFWCCRLRPGRG